MNQKMVQIVREIKYVKLNLWILIACDRIYYWPWVLGWSNQFCRYDDETYQIIQPFLFMSIHTENMLKRITNDCGSKYVYQVLIGQ